MRKTRVSKILFGYFLLSLLKAQVYFQQGIDTVYAFFPGSGQSVGQNPPYFPNNIYGRPDPNTSYTTPSASPHHICSLGFNGRIIVGFREYVLVDGPGVDFTVFENPFYSPYTGKVFVEPGIVSVSKDGIHFYAFPCDSLTLVGCAGRTPTNGDQDPFDPTVSGGDTFDLALIGLDTVRYIQIQDWTWYLVQHPNHPYYDPTLSGFDLDAVVGLHLVPASTSLSSSQIQVPAFHCRYLSQSQEIHLTVQHHPYSYTLYSYMGAIVKSGECGSSFCVISCEGVTPGLYLLRVGNHVCKVAIH